MKIKPLTPTTIHVAPFLVWIGAIFLPEILGTVVDGFYLFPAYLYAFKSIVCGLFLWAYKPWQYYERGTSTDILLGLALGLAVAVLWILPETPLMRDLFPTLYHQYHVWGIMMPGALPSYYDPTIAPILPVGHPSWVFSPEHCGWALTLLKLAGSALTIAIIEEYFFRGFLYRWLQNPSFLKVKLGNLDWYAFTITVLCFGMEHDRWIGGMLAGIAYGALAIKTGRLRASIVAHCVTNLLLGIYVILTRQYGFW